MGQDTFDIASPPFTGDDVLGLLEILRRDGFAIGIDEHLDARAILNACLSYKLNNKTSLRNWLAPVLCTNREEQRLFYLRFERWWLDLPRNRADLPDEPELPLDTQIDQEVVKPGWKSWLPNVLVAALVLLSVWLDVWFFNEDDIDPKPKPSPPPIRETEQQECSTVLPEIIGLSDRQAKAKITSTRLETRAGRNERRPSASTEIEEVAGRASEGSNSTVMLQVGEVTQAYSETVPRGRVMQAGWSVGVSGCRSVSYTLSLGAKESITYSIDVNGRVRDNSGDAVRNAIVVVASGVYFIPQTESVLPPDSFAGDQVQIMEDGSPYLEGFVGTPLVGHQSQVESGFFSPDGKRVVTAADDGARVWTADAAGVWTSKVLGNEFDGHTASVLYAAFSPDGKHVVTTSRDDTARVWSADTGGAWTSQVLSGHRGPVYHAAFSPDGERVVTASGDATARLWSENANGVWTAELLAGHEDVVWYAAFSPRGNSVVTASGDYTARVWNRVAGGDWSSRVLEGHTDDVGQAIFSPDGTRVATASEDGTARVWWWDIDGLWVSQVLDGQADAVWRVAYSPDGESVVTGSDNTARIWSRDAGEWSAQLLAGHSDEVLHVAFSPDGEHVVTASADNTARVWSNDGNGVWLSQELVGHTGSVSTVAFSSDGQRVVTASEDRTARVWGLGQILNADRWITTDADGNFRISTDHFDDAALVIKHPDHKTALGQGVLSDPGSVEIEAAMIPLGRGWTRHLREFESSIKWVLTLLPFMIAFAWWYRNCRLRNLVLEHRSSRNITSVAAVNIIEPPHELYRNAEFAHARTRVYSHEERGSGVLDADGTVESTVSRLGYFTPVYQSRLQLPNYLALIDRASFGDQQAELLGEFIERLVEGGVSVERYYFDRDPRVCAAAPGSGISQRSLAELAARYPEHRLMIFSDGRGLSHPFTGGRASWIGLLDAWAVRVLMTPVPAFHWTHRQVDLAASGLLVLPATYEGLQLFTDHIHGQSSSQQPARNWEPGYPEIIEEHPSRWLERASPAVEDVGEMLRQVHAYLDDDTYRWFCALAVYPELKWHITLYLGLELKAADGKPILDEAALLRLTRLPWLRHGVIPDWLREQLIGKLSSEDETSVRKFLRRLIRDPLEEPGSRFQLNIARPGEDLRPKHWSHFFKQLLASEPDDSPLRDAVFIQFLSGKSASRLQFQAPNKWSRKLFRRGMRSLGVKTVVGWAAAALITVAIWLSTGSLIAAVNKWFSPPGSSTIQKVTETSDDSILERFSTPGPGYTLADDSMEIFSQQGYSVNRCLRVCESGKHGSCVAAVVSGSGTCNLFASYSGFVETNTQDISVYVRGDPVLPEIEQRTIPSSEVKEPEKSADDTPEPLNIRLVARLNNSVAVVSFTDSGMSYSQSRQQSSRTQLSKTLSPDKSGIDQATAFFVSDDGLMFTAAYDQGAATASVQLPNGRPGVPTYTVTQNDKIMMAAIAIDGLSGGVSAIEMGETDPAEGDTIYLRGFSQQWRTQAGRIIGRTQSQNTGMPLLATDIQAMPGFSGAPVVDRNGQLVGMAVIEAESAVMLVIPVSFILDFRNEVNRQLRPRGKTSQ